MHHLYKKLRLVENMTFEVNVPKKDFINMFKKKVVYGDTDLLSGAFDHYLPEKESFRGIVGSRGFRVKLRKRFLKIYSTEAVATGIFRQQGEKLLIDVEINGYRKAIRVFALFAGLFMLLPFIASDDNFRQTGDWIFSIGWMFFNLLLLRLGYGYMRICMKSLKVELQEFILSKPDRE